MAVAEWLHIPSAKGRGEQIELLQNQFYLAETALVRNMRDIRLSLGRSAPEEFERLENIDYVTLSQHGYGRKRRAISIEVTTIDPYGVWVVREDGYPYPLGLTGKVSFYDIVYEHATVKNPGLQRSTLWLGNIGQKLTEALIGDMGEALQNIKQARLSG